MSKNKINNYTGPKRLSYEFKLMSSSEESEEFDFEAFNSGQPPKRTKKQTKPTLKRSKREGMCMLSGDESKSESSQTEQFQEKLRVESPKNSKIKKKEESKNLISIKDDKIIDTFIKNFKA